MKIVVESELRRPNINNNILDYLIQLVRVFLQQVVVDVVAQGGVDAFLKFEFSNSR